jgi:hypothetical protein
LVKDVATKPSQLAEPKREVDLKLLVELFSLAVTEKAQEHLLDHFGSERFGLCRDQLAIDPKERGPSGFNMEIRGIELHQCLDELFEGGCMSGIRDTLGHSH